MSQRITRCVLLVVAFIILFFTLWRNKNESVEQVHALPLQPTVTPTPTVLLQPVKVDNYHSVSWYGQEYCDKYSPACITTSGEKFDDTDFTVACSKKYRLGTVFKISYNGKTVVARCNDRGSFSEKYGRTLDLSKATFAALAPLSRGVIKVQLEKI